MIWNAKIIILIIIVFNLKDKFTMKPTLLILAAGIGSRYGGLKQMDPIGPSGEAIMDYSIFDAIRAGFGKVVFVIRRDIEDDFKEMFLDKLYPFVPVDYVFQDLDMLPSGIHLPEQRKKPWGTGHAMLVAEEKIDGPFAVINADDYYGPLSYKVMADFLINNNAKENLFSMVGFQLDKTLSEFGHVARGVCETNNKQFLVSIEERLNITKGSQGIYYIDGSDKEVSLIGKETVSMNFWGFQVNVFKYLNQYFRDFMEEFGNHPKKEFFIPLAVTRLIENKEASIQVLQSGESWFGVTYKNDKPRVIEEIRTRVDKGIYPKKLWS